MFYFIRHLSLPLALLVAGLASAQETAPATGTETPVPATETPAETEAAAPDAEALAIGTEVPIDGVGSIYTQETFGVWELRCERTVEGDDPCQLYQLLKDQDGNSVAEIIMFPLPAGQQAAIGATIVTPLETLLTQDILIQVDAGAAKRYPFTWCNNVSCIARVGFTANDVAAMKAGSKAVMTIVPVAAPDAKVQLTISLSGFTAGFEAVNAAAQP